jgi:hypothetical protein
MGQSALYALDHLVLELHSAEPRREDLDRLFHELSWVRIRSSVHKPTLCFSVSSNNHGFRIPRDCRQILRTDDFVGFETGNNDFYLTDGSSVFHLRPAQGEAYARISPLFFCKPKIAQASFWCFGLLKLLRPLGLYSLHAAGLATKYREGILVIGSSGSGKSTLAIGLIRAGLSYLSDDAVLLRCGSEVVEALGCRRSFYIDAAQSSNYCDFSLGEEQPDSNGGRRRRVAVDEAYPGQYISQCLPRTVVFPHVTRQERSTLKPVDGVRALGMLLAQSAPQLFDRSTMAGHLALLKRLLQQAETYELNAGMDLYHEPAKLIALIRKARGETNWHELSLS